jgi:hypothetical protein
MPEPAAEPATVHPFPDERRVRHVLPLLVDDQVAITHRGHSTIYDTPADLHAAVLVARSDLIAAAVDSAARRGRAQGRTRFARALRALRRAAQARLKADAAIWAAVVAVSAFGAKLLEIGGLGVFG